MKPLIFLTACTLKNGIKRAIQSPTRILGVLMIIGWWFFAIGGGFRGRNATASVNGAPAFDLPPENVFFALMFAVFLALFLLRSFVMFLVPGQYRQPDADVLFATPIRPWQVLLYKFIWDYALSLLLPLLILLFSGRRGMQGIESLIRNLPESASPEHFGRTALAAFLLLSLFLASLAYAVGMLINRDTPSGRLWRKVAGVTLFAVILFLFASVASAIANGDSVLANLVETVSGTLFRVVFYPIAAAADLAVAPLYGSVASGVAPGIFLLIASGALLWLAFRQAPHLFDMASRQAALSQVVREARRSGDQTWMIQKAAREGRMKPRRLRWLENMSPAGPAAIVWREAILTVRANMFMFGMFLLMTIGVLSLLTLDRGGGILFAVILVQFIMQLSIAMGFGQSGFAETLRRLDVQKPLPFTPMMQCLMECIGKSLAPMLISLLSALATAIITPQFWQVALGMAIGFPATIFVVVAVQLLVLLMFPDVDDPTQIAFRGLMQFLGSALAAAPGLVTAIGLATVMPIPVSALIGTLVNVSVAVVLITIASPIYSAYNATE